MRYKLMYIFIKKREKPMWLKELKTSSHGKEIIS